ncbi:MAG: hypothetical protein ATN35_04055 [Epulopiscium sp. Nele67-Bin004]|nr:MAG: hypothetical protein ATN35_04055 [Epulopiscium sp. Nele67-Bin004]
MKMFAKIVAGLAGVVLGGSVAFGAITNLMYEDSKYDKNKIFTLEQVVGWQYFFDETDYNDRIEGLYRGYVSALGNSDTRYLTEEEAEVWIAGDNGKYVGVGIKFTWGVTSQYLVVTQVIEGSPADIMGISVGDRITQIDGIYAMMSNEDKIYDKLSYSGDDIVTYTILKMSGIDEGQTLDKPLWVEELDSEICTTMVLEDEIGYIKLNNLKKGATDIIVDGIASMEGVSGWIIDLRYVSDADLDEVLEFTDILTDTGEMFYSVDRKGETTYYNSVSQKTDEDIVLLVNSSTSGIVEALVAAVKQDDYITIVGTQTAGSASIQDFVRLEDGSALLISTQHLFLPDDTPIGTSPIEAEVYVDLDIDYTLKLVTEGVSDLELDNQLQTALQLVLQNSKVSDNN